jgi:hypothetical protein
MTIENNHVLDKIQKKHIDGRVGVTIPRDSRSNMPERDAVLQLRYAPSIVKKSMRLHSNKTLPDTLDLYVIYAKEEHPPKGHDPIQWFLVTNTPITTADEASTYIGYYVQRWKIERFHYVLKSGCAIEKLQERSIEKTTIMILMYSIIAVRIMNITYAGRLTPDMRCSALLEEDEWKLLYCIAYKTKRSPKKPYSMKEASGNCVSEDFIGQLGGPKRAPSDGLPGVKTIWQGLMKLHVLLSCRELLACDFVGQV